MRQGIICFLLCFSIFHKVQSQSLPVGMSVLEERFRSAQLLGQTDSLVSFAIRPLAKDTINTLLLDTAEIFGLRASISVLPLNWTQQFNGSYPFGWNDGAMIAAKGYQSQLSAGVAGELGPLSFQLRPQITWANNPEYPGFPLEHYPVVWKDYYSHYNNIDLPERMGEGRYSRMDLGQSYVKLNYRNFSLGLSTENLWWGPGSQSSLLMTNTAPGFEHLSLNTNKPVRTRIGSFEGQFIWGRLEGTPYQPTQIKDYLFGTGTIYAPKKKDWRHISGFNLNFQPALIPGLFVGISRTSQIYDSDVRKTSDVLPFFSKYSKGLGDAKVYGSPDRYTSAYFRKA